MMVGQEGPTMTRRRLQLTDPRGVARRRPCARAMRSLGQPYDRATNPITPNVPSSPLTTRSQVRTRVRQLALVARWTQLRATARDRRHGSESGGADPEHQKVPVSYRGRDWRARLEGETGGRDWRARLEGGTGGRDWRAGLLGSGVSFRDAGAPSRQVVGAGDIGSLTQNNGWPSRAALRVGSAVADGEFYLVPQRSPIAAAGSGR
jgi:hypothetical protein